MEEVKEKGFPQSWNQTPRTGSMLNPYIKRQEYHCIFSMLLPHGKCVVETGKLWIRSVWWNEFFCTLH